MQSEAEQIRDLTDELCGRACKHLEACGYTPEKAIQSWKKVSLKNLGVTVIYGEQNTAATIEDEVKLKKAVEALREKAKK
jgi:two-component SAPR family response regulator